MKKGDDWQGVHRTGLIQFWYGAGFVSYQAESTFTKVGWKTWLDSGPWRPDWTGSIFSSGSVPGFYSQQANAQNQK